MPLAPAEVEVLIHGSALGAFPGQESVGVVVEAGDSAGHLMGRNVVIPRLLPCGECEPCRRGRLTCCPELRARPRRPVPRERVPARFLLPLEPPFVAAPPEPGESWRYAALADSLLAPYAALVRAGLTPGTLCAVLGGGVQAGLAAVVIRALGGAAVVVTPEPREQAVLCQPPFHALAALDPATLDPDAMRLRLREIAMEAGLLSHGLVLIESSGSDAGRARAVSMSEAGGTVLLLGRGHELGPATVASTTEPALAAEPVGGPGLTSIALLDRVSTEQCQIHGAGAPHPDLLPELVALLDRAGVDLSTLVRAVEPGDVDAEMSARRARRTDVLLPIARFSERASV